MRTSILRALVAFSILSSLACGVSGSREREPAPAPTPTEVEIAPSDQQGGGTVVTQGGRNVWPPSGPGCERFVACCDAASATSPAARLMCQLTVAGRTFDCVNGIETIRRYLHESGGSIPPACAP